jgi:hypothetical protein
VFSGVGVAFGFAFVPQSISPCKLRVSVLQGSLESCFLAQIFIAFYSLLNFSLLSSVVFAFAFAFFSKRFSPCLRVSVVIFDFLVFAIAR